MTFPVTFKNIQPNCLTILVVRGQRTGYDAANLPKSFRLRSVTRQAVCLGSQSVA